jgi:hypothetical protein
MKKFEPVQHDSSTRLHRLILLVDARQEQTANSSNAAMVLP